MLCARPDNPYMKSFDMKLRLTFCLTAYGEKGVHLFISNIRESPTSKLSDLKV